MAFTKHHGDGAKIRNTMISASAKEGSFAQNTKLDMT